MCSTAHLPLATFFAATMAPAQPLEYPREVPVALTTTATPPPRSPPANDVTARWQGCQRCGSQRVVAVAISFECRSVAQRRLCEHCGQVQGRFPMPLPYQGHLS
jgi:hypothetical protein